MPAVRQVIRQAATQDYKATAIINGIVTSSPFRMRLKSVPGTRQAE
jgi:hypothetical protein